MGDFRSQSSIKTLFSYISFVAENLLPIGAKKDKRKAGLI